MKLRKLGALATGAALAVSACQPAGTGGGASPTGGAAASGGGGGGGTTVTLGVSLPLQGSNLPAAGPIRDGIQLAVDEANAAGGVNGYQVEIQVLDHSVNGIHNPDQGAQDARTFVDNPQVFAVIGTLNSNVARAQIPITNSAGLAQCSPANTAVDLTIGDASKQLRPDNPDKNNYVRVVANDDFQGPAGADFTFNNLGKKSVFIIDDTETFGKGVADTFQRRFEELGGTVVGREGLPATTTDYTPVLTEAKGQNPEAFYFGGVTATGGGLIRKQMEGVDMLDVAYVGPDGIQDGPGSAEGSFINIAGTAADNSFSSVAAPGEFEAQAEFEQKYEEEFGEAPGAYSPTGYACAQVFLQALENVEATDDMAALRESVRAYVAESGSTFSTVLGELAFDENGDPTLQIMSFYEVDPEAAEGAGDWVFVEQVSRSE